MFEEFEFKPVETKINGKIHDKDSIWRKSPSKEVDRAWNHISMEGFEAIAVTGNDVEKSGKNKSLTVQIPLDSNAPEPLFLAQIEVFHLIHCLDTLRKEIWRDHYFEGEPFEKRRVHTTHCLHMILQSLTCQADVGIVTHNWVKSEHWDEEDKIKRRGNGDKIRKNPDFSIHKKCRNFDALLEWAFQRSLKNANTLWLSMIWKEGMEYIEGDSYAPEE